MVKKFVKWLKKLMKRCFPSYRVALRNEKKLIALQSQMDQVKKRIDEVRIQSQLLYWWDHTPPGGSLRQTQIDFYRQMPRAEGDLRLVQRLLAHMLSQFKRICDENDICGWWLQAGTLLGAIRHQGFVPWDDDLDVGIMREDLERLREVLKDHPIFEIRDYYHTKNMCGRMSKFTYRNSTIPCFIDLPVYDTMTCSNPDEGWEIIKAQRAQFEKELRSLVPQLQRAYNFETADTPEDIELLQQTCERYRWEGHQDEDNIIFWAVDCTNPGWKRCFPKELLFPLDYAQFEGTVYPVPQKSETYLTLQYKNMWMLPGNVGISKHWEFFGFSDALEDIRKKLAEDGVEE